MCKITWVRKIQAGDLNSGLTLLTHPASLPPWGGLKEKAVGTWAHSGAFVETWGLEIPSCWSPRKAVRPPPLLPARLILLMEFLGKITHCSISLLISWQPPRPRTLLKLLRLHCSCLFPIFLLPGGAQRCRGQAHLPRASTPAQQVHPQLSPKASRAAETRQKFGRML